jgi:hypothetical protein
VLPAAITGEVSGSVGVIGAQGQTGLTGFDALEGAFDLVEKLRAEFTPDPPCQPALAGAAVGQYDGELRRNFEIFGDHLQAALRHVRNRAVTRQTGPELNLPKAPAQAPFASTSICQHVDPQACSIRVYRRLQPLLAKNYWNLPSGNPCNLTVLFELFLPSCRSDTNIANKVTSFSW